MSSVSLASVELHERDLGRVSGCRVTAQKTSDESMISSEGKTTCFVCNLPIQSHQVGLVWQGGNGVDDLLRDQVSQDIIRGRLGRGHRRDSSAQMTTIEPDDINLYGSDTSTPPMTGKRRRSSLLGDLIHSWSSRDKSGGESRGQSGGQQKKGGPLIGTLPWGKRGEGRGESQAEVMEKIRKRRDSWDITILRKPSVMDIKTDLSRIIQETVGSKEERLRENVAGTAETHQSNVVSMKNKHQLYRSKMESTTPLPASPTETSPDVPRAGSPTPAPPLPGDIPNIRNISASPCPEMSPSIMTQTTETRSLNSSNSKDSSGCGQAVMDPLSGGRLHENYSGTSEDSGSVLSPQVSPTSRHKFRRQSTAYDECLNQKGSSSARRGSRPFLSPGDEETHRVLRRDSLSPDSAAEDGAGVRKGRRDSGGDVSDNSRESQTSPRSLWKRAGRRKSSNATLEEKLNKKKNKQKHSPDSSSSREPSPKFGEGKKNLISKD